MLKLRIGHRLLPAAADLFLKQCQPVLSEHAERDRYARSERCRWFNRCHSLILHSSATEANWRSVATSLVTNYSTKHPRTGSTRTSGRSSRTYPKLSSSNDSPLT